MSDALQSLALRNNLRNEVRDIAEKMRAGNLDAEAAIAALEAAADQEESELDAEDIEVDFEVGQSMKAGPIFAMLAGTGTGKSTLQGDPVDVALLEAISIRDKISAKRIVGDAANDADREDYKNCLAALHSALSHLISKQD